MPERVKDIASFLREVAYLLQVVSDCRSVLFTIEFRENLPSALEEVKGRLQTVTDNPYIWEPAAHESMRIAGLYGAQLNLKLESFESALIAFESEGGQDRLEDALDKGAIILSSLAGAIPGFGSFAQELVDFILKELRKRFRWRPW